MNRGSLGELDIGESWATPVSADIRDGLFVTVTVYQISVCNGFISVGRIEVRSTACYLR